MRILIFKADTLQVIYLRPVKKEAGKVNDWISQRHGAPCPPISMVAIFDDQLFECYQDSTPHGLHQRVILNLKPEATSDFIQLIQSL